MPSNVCKYGNTWKICKLGTVIQTGNTVRGSFRASIPPECIKVTRSSNTHMKSLFPSRVNDIGGVSSSRVSATTPKQQNNSFVGILDAREKVKFTPIVMRRVFDQNTNGEVVISEQQHVMTTADELSEKQSSPATFSPLASLFKSKSDISLFQSPMSPFFFNQTKDYYDSENDMIVYSPEGIIATPSFDIWGFGVIMTNILLGRCMNLPTFEKADDAIIKKLYYYNNMELEKICEKVESRVGEDAADLIRMLLQKDPRNRPQSMDDVLSHAYFRSTIIDI